MILLASLLLDLALLAVKGYRTREMGILLKMAAFMGVVNAIAYYMIAGLTAAFGEQSLFWVICIAAAKIFSVWIFLQTEKAEKRNFPAHLLILLLSVCVHGHPIVGIVSELVQLLFLLYIERSEPVEEEPPSGRLQENRQYLATIEESYRKNRAMMHDLQNHIIALRSLAEAGEYEKLLAYTNSMTEKMAENLFPVRSGNLVLDALLADKYHIARRNQIFVEFVSVQYQADLDSGDLCTVIGNLFDNAITENRKANRTEERRISVSICTAGEWLTVELKNPLFHTINVKNGLPASEKPDVEHHGIGLRNVRRVCDAYGGELLWNDSDGIFTVTARLKVTSNT